MHTYLFMILLCFSLTAEAGIIRDSIQQRERLTEIKKIPDIAYGSETKQKLDLYLPPHPVRAPIIVMVHGGAWKAGDKKSDNVVQHKMGRWVSRGAIFVSLNYRLVPHVTPLMQVEDVGHALAYVQSHAQEWGGDPEKIVLMGHSAGAHLISLLSSDPMHYSYLGVKPWKGSVSLDTATMDLVQTMERNHYRFYDDAFGEDRDNWIANSPLFQLTSFAPPMLLICSSVREDKPCENSNPFVAKGRELGVRIEISEQRLNHGEINTELGKENDYTQRVEAFMRSVGMDL